MASGNYRLVIVAEDARTSRAKNQQPKISDQKMKASLSPGATGGESEFVNIYGGWTVHGGGAFSGKDATKVDRSAGYMARYIAKNLVAAGLADECLLQLGYCIGLVDPVSVMVNTYGSGKLNENEIAHLSAKYSRFRKKE